ncbi:hypothetical protein [Leisingera daeponensis]|uniref:hypothetical protein n=1 Tax=Leisingera daeponensis TaxID=405746 RepID=UPI001C95BB91|nr:hypothetical protein [Leisingera daeponensis]MBY6059689.1 hypothetical protein [Leisingera daeponensis]
MDEAHSRANTARRCQTDYSTGTESKAGPAISKREISSEDNQSINCGCEPDGVDRMDDPGPAEGPVPVLVGNTKDFAGMPCCLSARWNTKEGGFGMRDRSWQSTNFNGSKLIAHAFRLSSGSPQ